MNRFAWFLLWAVVFSFFATWGLACYVAVLFSQGT